MLTDDDRRYLHDTLEHVHGARAASLLMALLPPTGWADLATRQDLEALRADLRGELAELRGEVRGEMNGLRGEMNGLRGELRGEIRGIWPRLAATNIASMIGVAALVLAAAR